MTRRQSMQGMLCVALGIPLAFVLFTPGIIPQVEFDSVPLIKSNALYELLVSVTVLFPFVLALVCSGGRTDRGQEIARGIALASGGGALVVLALLTLVALYGLGWSGSSNGLWKMRLLACLVLFVVNAVLVWTALRGPSGVITGISGLAIVGVAAYALLVCVGFRRADQLAERNARGYRHRMEADSHAAESAVRSLIYCAISYRASNPQQQIPGDLASLVRVAGCDPRLLNRDTTPEYELSFSTAPWSESSAGADNCRVIATFTGNRLPDNHGAQFSDGRTFTGDCSGVIREREQRCKAGGCDLVVGFAPATAFNSLLLDIDHFAAATHTYPATLAELQETAAQPRGVSDYLSNQKAADLSHNIIRWGAYTVRYMPDPAHNFQVDARCEMYATSCMRSYLLDDQGFVHGTGQNRGATLSDPIVETCELEAGSRFCDGKPSRSTRHAATKPSESP